VLVWRRVLSDDAWGAPVAGSPHRRPAALGHDRPL